MSIFVLRFPKQDDWLECGYGVARRFVWESLFRDQKLRNGWGYPHLGLEQQSEQSWIEKAMEKPMGKGKQRTDKRENAQKRYDILKLMLEVKQGDVIIIPNVSKIEPYEPSFFTVVTAEKNKKPGNRVYYFEDRSSNQCAYLQDFGHVIPVRNIQSFTQQDFQISLRAWQKAFNRVNDQRIHDWIARHYDQSQFE